MDIKRLKDGTWDLNSLSIDELKDLSRMIETAKESKRKERFVELSNKATEALNQLKEEFPFATFWVPCSTKRSLDTEIDVFAEVDRFSRADFCL